MRASIVDARPNEPVCSVRTVTGVGTGVRKVVDAGSVVADRPPEGDIAN